MVPEEWERLEIGQVASVVTGSTPPTGNREFYGGEVPFVSPADLGSHRWVKETGKTLTQEGLSVSRRIPAGATLFVCIGSTIGKVGQAQTDLVTNQQINAVIPKDSTDPDFLFYELSHRSVHIARLAGNQAVPIINKSQFSAEFVVLPPLPEQKKIAEILSTWDKAIETTGKLLANAEAQKKALMQQLLTGKQRLKGIEGEWRTAKLGDICDVKGGKRLPKGCSLTADVTAHPYIRVADMRMGYIDTANIMYVPEDVAKSITRYTINSDDLFISVAGTLGLAGEVPPSLDGANLTENADKLTNIKINKKFLLYFLQSERIQKEIERARTTNAQPKLALERIRQFNVPMPSDKEQARIADIISTMVDECRLLKDDLSFLLNEKRALMQQLLTGKRRVTT